MLIVFPQNNRESSLNSGYYPKSLEVGLESRERKVKLQSVSPRMRRCAYVGETGTEKQDKTRWGMKVGVGANGTLMVTISRSEDTNLQLMARDE